MARVIGLMSGTSLDGVDAAWLETDGETVQAFGPTVTLAYDAAMRRDLRAILDRAPALGPDDPALADAERRMTGYHAEAVRLIGRPADLIGFHGQTILHRPDQRRTWQIGDAAALARRLQTPVVYDFRSDDVAAGGQGAPLVPAYHAALATDLPKPLAILNIGGVANVTWIGVDGELMAFDTGPGNGPMDDWAERHTGARFDQDGAMAKAGKVDHAVLSRLLSHPYFTQPAPKSLDRLDFATALGASGLDRLSPADGAATLASFTVGAVTAARFPAPPVRWLVCGGGRHNPALMGGLQRGINVSVDPVEAVGWDGDSLEAQCFAFLAMRSARRLPISFIGTTGVPAARTGGRLARP